LHSTDLVDSDSLHVVETASVALRCDETAARESLVMQVLVTVRGDQIAAVPSERPVPTVEVMDVAILQAQKPCVVVLELHRRTGLD
jgi:hypothetical protein